jgi:hypothetical protein
MDMSKVEGMNMLKKHERPSNQRREVEGMDMVGIHMVEGLNMVEERLSKERSEVEGMDMVEERPSKERPEVEGMDMESMDMMEDMTARVDMEVVEGEHEGVVLVKY